MDKNKLMEIKKRLLALGLTGVMLGTVGCAKNEVPECISISSEYSNIDDYYKYIIQNGEAIKLYNSQNVYLLINKETYEVTEYIFHKRDILGGLGTCYELYDLQSENMLVYSNGISTSYNREYFNYIIENNYQVCLTEVSDYVEGNTGKEYYSFEEIKELEPQIVEGLKKIISAKEKTK